MSSDSAFSTRNCFERAAHAAQRFEVVSHSLGEMADHFLNYDSLLQGRPLEQVLLVMADELPQALLVRALAKEGLELIEQITWETYILEHSQEAARLREQLPVLTKLVKTVEAEKPFFQQTIEKMNSIIQLIMDAPKELSDIMAPLKSSLKSNPE